MITKEEFEKAVEYCTGDVIDCAGCPLNDKDLKCGVYLTEYIKNEPAPAATGTSSEVSKDTDNIHIDDSTKEQICQAYKTADEACSCSATIDIGQN